MPCQSQNYKKHAIAPNNNSINWRNLDFFVRLRRLITRFLPYDFNLEAANYMKHNFEMTKVTRGDKGLVPVTPAAQGIPPEEVQSG